MKQSDALAMLLAERATLAKEKADLEAKLAASKTPGKLSLKVSAKGAISIYGLTKQFPLTLYVSQWRRIEAIRDDIEAFILANLAVKPDGVDKEGKPIKTYLVPAKGE